jgi:hypothetical protein
MRVYVFRIHTGPVHVEYYRRKIDVAYPGSDPWGGTEYVYFTVHANTLDFAKTRAWAMAGMADYPQPCAFHPQLMSERGV